MFGYLKNKKLKTTSFGAKLIQSSTATAVLNLLGLKSAAIRDAADFDPIGAAEAVDTRLSAHAGNVANPHKVSLSQLGATTLGTNLIQSSTATAVLNLLGLKSAAIRDATEFDPIGAAGAVDAKLSAHAGNTVNPHNVSLTQLGATATGIAFITATDVSAQKNLINYGFNYYQLTVPANPQRGERWAELSSTGEIADIWKWNGTVWLKEQEIIVPVEQKNLSTFPASVFWGYVNTKYNIWVNELILDTTLNSGFIAGNTYFSAAFTLGGAQQIGYSIDTVNQNLAIGVTRKTIDKNIPTFPGSSATQGGHMFNASISKVGMGTTTTLFCAVAISYQQSRK
jgi:hypothetical protein